MTCQEIDKFTIYQNQYYRENARRYTLCEVVDSTPWGSAIEERRLKASRPVITPS